MRDYCNTTLDRVTAHFPIKIVVFPAFDIDYNVSTESVLEGWLAHMGRWGLRWIFCWLSVLVTACAQLASPTPTEKPQNRAPLQGFTPPPTASPTEPIRPAYTLTPLGSTNATASAEDAGGIAITSPTCYETSAQSLTCLGWIQNTDTAPYTDIRIYVALLNRQGKAITTAETIPPFTVLFPEEGNPFRVIFETIPDEAWGIYAQIHHASRITSGADTMYFPVIVEQIQSERRGSAYRVYGRVHNTDLRAAGAVRIVVSLKNTDENHQMVTGFRILDLLAGDTVLAPSTTVPYELVIDQLVPETNARVIVDAQGRAFSPN